MRMSAMHQGARFAVGLLLALVLCAAAVTALGMTVVTIKDAVASGGSPAEFEARIRHYSDRFEQTDGGLLIIQRPHPLVLHFGMLAVSWAVTLGATVALRRVLGTQQNHNTASPASPPDANTGAS